MSDKYCVDCKHYENKITHPYRLNNEIFFGTELHLCNRELKINVITGKLIYDKNSLDCLKEREDAMRLEHLRCGVKGKYFELKDVK